MLRRILKTGVITATLLGTQSVCTVTAAAPEAQNYSSHAEVQVFIDEMVSKHNFSRDELETLFSQAQRRDDIIELISKPAEKRLEWHEYRKIFLTPERIDGGVAFWNSNSKALQLAEREFGVDTQAIVAIIGVETRYGKNTGSHRVLDALATLAFDYPPRSKFFRGELEEYLLLAREDDINLLETKGSYAGAMGYGQFIPSSYRNYAIDFDRDGKRDLWNSPMDIIGSVANYLHVHGWKPGATVTLPATVSGDRYTNALERGLKPVTPVSELLREGIHPSTPLPEDPQAALIQLQNLEGPEYWLGLNNFYVITRYNHSPLYAMAVYQLGEEIRRAFALSQQAVHE